MSFQYMGQEQCGGSECHHIKAVQNEFDWEMWVVAGEAPLVMKVLVDASKSLAEEPHGLPLQQNAARRLTTTVFSNWSTNAPIGPERFPIHSARGRRARPGARYHRESRSRRPLKITSSEAPMSAAIAIHSVAAPAAARAMKTSFTPSAAAMFCRITRSVRRA